jgi:hypothetical protein
MPKLSVLTCLFVLASSGCAPVQAPPTTTAQPAAEVQQPAKPNPAAAQPQELAPERKVAMYMGCWSFFNSKKLEKLLECYQDQAAFEVVDSV